MNIRQNVRALPTLLVSLCFGLGLLFLFNPLPGNAASGGAGSAGGGSIRGGTPAEQRAILHFKRADKQRVRGIEETRMGLEESDPEKREEHMEAAERKFKRALREYKKAARADKKFHHAYNGIGFCQRMLGDYEAALEAYDKALAIEPGFSPAIEYRGEAYLRLGRLDDAKAAYMELFSSQRKLADLLMRKMNVWLDSQKVGATGNDSVLASFREWVDKRSEIAEQTATLVPGEAGAHW